MELHWDADALWNAEKEFFIDNLLVRIHYIIVVIRWTGLAPWEFEAPSSPSAPPVWVVRVGDDGELRPWHYIYEGRRGQWVTPTMALHIRIPPRRCSRSSTDGGAHLPWSCIGMQMHFGMQRKSSLLTTY